ncbi:MAG TPA: type 2 lantipeptide synthetase LanM, partial [Cyanobacteria bacterium UBA8803]|nr:type 2 lantipeptide synthetase LanM [Cyanobacteria bacterium UBA9273]HBL58196.1 type 2 lantipeptide synthetase LanM [Cyanobacteria bacterium UBA8803]
AENTPVPPRVGGLGGLNDRYSLSSEEVIPLSPNDYIHEIVSGFEQMYRFLMARREVLLAANGPLAGMSRKRVRFIFRPTRIYGAILQKLSDPKYLRDGVDYSIEIDILSRAYTVTPEKPAAWPILQAERQAMEQLDIPYFAAYPHRDELPIGVEAPIGQYFQEPSYIQVLNQLQRLSEMDLAQQIELIKGSIYARVMRTPLTQPSVSASRVDVSTITPLSREELVKEATRLAEEIQERAIWGTDGSVKWISFGYIPNAARFQLMPLPEDLYNGNGGIALFLAALDFVRGTNQFRELVLGAVQPIRQLLHCSDPDSTRSLVRQGIGAGTGLGSIIYALVRISQFLGEGTLLDDAQRVAALITPNLIAADEQFDTIGGAAGAILGLLALYEQTGKFGILERAVDCGHHLLAHQCDAFRGPTLSQSLLNRPNAKGQTPKSGRAWQILGQRLYTGFSHGAAGIAYALLRLYAVTYDNVYLEAADEAIAYERSVFSPAAANWPDLRQIAQQPNGQPGFMVSWCHGAAGIGLARLGGLSIWQTDDIVQDVDIALQTTQRYPLEDVDCLCCGNFGRIEMLLVGAETLARPDLAEMAATKAAWVVHRAAAVGGYQFLNLPSSVFSPSFFQGTAGIGYELLRLAYPQLLPSVLLLAKCIAKSFLLSIST